MTDLTVFGSARVDAFLFLPDEMAEQVCKLDTQKCVIELSYSAKLPLTDSILKTGGNGANVAVGVTRMGNITTLVAELGEGALSDMAKKDLAKEIDMHYVSQSEGVNQGFGAVIVYRGERTILSYYSPKRPDFPNDLQSTPWTYLTSVGDNFEGFYEDVFNWVTSKKSKLVFNPGGRQIAKGTDWLTKYLNITYLVMVNREEAEQIVGMEKTKGKEKELLDALYSFGPKNVVITDGREGSYAKTAENDYLQVGILPIDAIERTGAGDSYSTGMIAALVQEKTIGEAMVWGTINAASVIGFVGPQDGLLTKEALPHWLELARSAQVVAKKF